MQEPIGKRHVSNFWNSTLNTTVNQSPVHIRGRGCHSVAVATTVTLLACFFCEDRKKRNTMVISRNTLMRTAQEFSEASTVHGVSYVFSQSLPRVDRFLWAILTTIRFCIPCLNTVIFKIWKPCIGNNC